MAQKIYLRGGDQYPESQALSIVEGDTARWISRDTGYIVDFGIRSPFKKTKYDVPAHASKGSGVIVGRTGHYPYTLTQVFKTKGRKTKARSVANEGMMVKGAAAGGPDVEILP